MALERLFTDQRSASYFFCPAKKHKFKEVNWSEVSTKSVVNLKADSLLVESMTADQRR